MCMPGAGLFQTKKVLVCFINVYLHAKNQKQKPIHSRDVRIKGRKHARGRNAQN